MSDIRSRGGRRPDTGVSLCIPNWNHRNYLARCIKSALNAAAFLRKNSVKCQIVVVDDFSRDGSQRFLFSLSMKHPPGFIDVVLAPENRGLAAARNIAISRARYRYVCFMDADNELIPENLFMFWRAIKQTRAAIVYGNLIAVSNSKVDKLLSNDFIHEDIYIENYVDAFSMVDADRVEMIGGYYGAHAPAHEDWELILHLIAENQDIVFLPITLGYYNVSTLSMIVTTQYDHTKMRRVFDQRRTGFPSTFEPRRIYHPDLGWL
jgi:glycosyltransferase involved in cell wall biosynthesis